MTKRRRTDNTMTKRRTDNTMTNVIVLMFTIISCCLSATPSPLYYK
jgi:hypothetical protein